ncbi:M23 family metallopeptidase [Sphingomonas lutea]|uniref:M23 family metallopeptidase n=1 Tax=Sphingomonas lutea TaxID=1045317 RepID=A0A7G9SHM9_9SPHN|nr:M23 family metallopeptidase [Sphingomonas lutea]QNN67354.1 M23 family metallopeptidase [Sphingomonas lutea]
MTQVLAAATGLFRDREFFVHDGAKLRRFRISAMIQIVAVAALFALISWSSYAVGRIITSSPALTSKIVSGENYSAQLAELTAETERRVQAIEQRQMALAAALVDQDIDPASLRKLGFYPAANGGRGGPLEKAGNATFKALFNSWKKLDSIQDGVISVPADKPVKTAAFTSGYGVRSDPFKGGAAMHAGIDLSGPIGTPIYATADGVVSAAGWNSGGYGNLVKVDHGRGIETRYGHLASMTVSPGQRVTRGQVIGRMGSTGRSTGSHLHYEVRIDGRAVNPVPFMKSTDYVLAMQKKSNTHAMESLAIGGPGARR